jgi:hypothetical protein
MINGDAAYLILFRRGDPDHMLAISWLYDLYRNLCRVYTTLRGECDVNIDAGEHIPSVAGERPQLFQDRQGLVGQGDKVTELHLHAVA